MTQEEKSQELYKTIAPLLEEGKNLEIHPTGTSMYPLLTGEDVVILKPLIGEEKLRKNQILLYRRENGLLVLHRLCKIREDGFYFVGDNQTEVEGPLRREAVLAVVTDICRHGKWFSAKAPWYLFLSRVWLFLRPVRPLISRPLGMVYRKIKGRK
ncbi:MAG: hypothetical protein IJ733_03035 [Lachnospiraceae bacterium]|nr:hypothetical protein [Lachnospiraceae bacterium]